MDTQQAKRELIQLEQKLSRLFEHFQKVYVERTNHQAELSNQDINQPLSQEFDLFSNEIVNIKTKTIELMKDIQRGYDQKSCLRILEKLKAQSK